MEIRNAIKILRKYPRVLGQFLRDCKSPYITIYQVSRLTGLDYRSAKEYVYDLMADGILVKYQTTFRLSEDFMALRPSL